MTVEYYLTNLNSSNITKLTMIKKTTLLTILAKQNVRLVKLVKNIT